MEEEELPPYKIILLGDSSVGKTSIIDRYCKNVFQEECPPTVGVGYQAKHIEIDGQKVKLSIWDTAGQEKFRTLTKQFYRNVDGVLLVYDISDSKTFESIDQYWFQQLDLNTNTNYQAIIIGNKTDLRTADGNEDMKFVSTQEGEDLAKKHATLFIETSAKSAEHVQSAFQELVTRIHQTKAKNEQPKSLDISNNDDANNAGWCC